MTREEAIDILKCDISADKQGIEYCHDEVGIEALEMAIKALEQEPSGDLISRQAVKEWLWDNAIYGYDRFIDKLPSVNPQPICEDAISRQAVNNLQKYRYYCGENAITCVSLASINRLPSVNPQESCEDCISRAQALSDYADWFGYGYRDNSFYNHLKNMPSIQPKPKTGHWIAIDEEPHEDYECDRCGYVCSTFTANIKPNEEYKFCPNCGARMVEPQESEEV